MHVIYLGWFSTDTYQTRILGEGVLSIKLDKFISKNNQNICAMPHLTFMTRLNGITQSRYLSL